MRCPIDINFEPQDVLAPNLIAASKIMSIGPYVAEIARVPWLCYFGLLLNKKSELRKMSRVSSGRIFSGRPRDIRNTQTPILA